MRAKRTVLLKAKTEQMDIEILLTEKKAFNFSKKLLRNHKESMKRWLGPYKIFVCGRGECKYRNKVYIKSPQGPQPTINMYFERITT
jgi:hypothetical protein